MTERRDALTELMRQHVGTHAGGRWTVTGFTERAVDPESGYRPSTGLVGKIIRGDSYGVTPKLIGALAAGLGIPRSVVAAAAHFQLIGYDESELTEGAPAEVLHRIGVDPQRAPKARAVAERWAKDDSEQR